MLGFLDGYELGFVEGFVDVEGFLDGALLEMADGILLGLDEGCMLGFLDGIELGLAEGFSDCGFLGLADGK